MSVVLRSWLAATAMFLIAALASPAVTVAQVPGGCPWCTTPTTCGSVGEPTPYDFCAYSQATGCVTPEPSETGCTPENLVAEKSDALRLLGVTWNQGEWISTEDPGRQRFIAVDDQHLLLWSCRGEVIAALRRLSDGSTLRINAAPFSARYTLND
jgi:hypothetical protein